VFEGVYTDFYRLAGECETPVYKKYNLAFGFNDGQVRVTQSVACLTSYRVSKKMRMVAKKTGIPDRKSRRTGYHGCDASQLRQRPGRTRRIVSSEPQL
jgi:hypothetical protein